MRYIDPPGFIPKKFPTWVNPYSRCGTHGSNIIALINSENQWKHKHPEKIQMGEVIYVPDDSLKIIKEALLQRNLKLVPDSDVCLPGWFLVMNII